MLIDKVEVTFRGGNGGNGKVSFVKIGRGPDGGSGGNGGDLYLVGSDDLFLLNQFSSKNIFSAENGVDGDRNNNPGAKGKNLEIMLPIGTEIISKKTGKDIHVKETTGAKYLLCRGGKGGKGNWEFRSARLTTPKFAKKGEKGEEKKVILNLKLIADFGLIGLPNSGKSSLLNELTGSHAKVANYQFTTLSPNLGIFNNRVIADIPGLIEGASNGRGLGIDFLKHIEKVKILIHCISSESENPNSDYNTVRNELKLYNPELLKKREIILITKSDLSTNHKFKNALPVSIYDPESILELKKLLTKV